MEFTNVRVIVWAELLGPPYANEFTESPSDGATLYLARTCLEYILYVIRGILSDICNA